MAEQQDDLCDAMGALSVERLKELGLDDNVQKMLIYLKNNYESIFSWDIKRLTGIKQNLMLNRIDKIREKCEMITDNKDDKFNLNKFYLQLITSYEHFISGNYKESLLEIESVVKCLESCIFDDLNEQYSDACNHIARASNAYVALTLNLDSEKLMKNIKSVNNLNRAEKAAICAVKARVFMEYPPKGNDIALKFAENARNLHSTEPEWIIIWLKAKGRVRRYYSQYKMPEEDEIVAAEMLCTTKTKPWLLIQASKIYMEVAFIHKMNRNFDESHKYYKISSNLTFKAIELAKDDIEQLYSCLMICIDYPEEYNSKPVLNKVIQKLTNVKNSCVDQVLGKYYLKFEKDYEKAKMYLSRSMASGNFNSSLQLIKVECLLQPVNKFPIVETLNMLYDVFPSPKRRLIILSQILIYYHYCENNPKKFMQHLKLYMDQDIDDTFKKRHLIYSYPLFKIDGIFKKNQFLNVLIMKLKSITNFHDWSNEEKQMFDNTYVKFNKMLKIQIYENQYFDDKTLGFCKQNYNNNSNKKYFHKNTSNRNDYNRNWQKQRVNVSENDIKQNRQHSSTSDIGQNKYPGKHALLNKQLFIHKNIKTENDINKPFYKEFTNKKSNVLDESMNNLDNSNKNDMKLKKFDKQYGSLGNIHVVSKDFKPTGSGFQSDSRSKGFNKSNWQNRRGGSQNQEGCSFQNKF